MRTSPACRPRELGGVQKKQRAFYESVIITLKAVIAYAGRLAGLAKTMQKRFNEGDPRRDNLASIADRLGGAVPANALRTFLDAVQCLLLMHSVLHLTGERFR